MEWPGLEPVATWDVGTAGGGLALYAIVLAPALRSVVDGLQGKH